MVARYATLGGKPLLDPFEEMQGARKNHTPTDFWLKANSFTCPLGKDPGRAYVLLTRRDLAALNSETLHSLVWTDGSTVTTFPSLVIVRADCMNLSHEGDANSCYLVELADKRQLLRGAINKQYNVRVPAKSGADTEDNYYPESLNAGSLWTWQTMLDDIWTNLPSGIRGTPPTLPYSPDGIPEGYRLIGLDAWQQYNCIVEKLGSRIRYNPLTGAFSLIQLGTDQAGLDESLAALRGRLMYNYDPFDSNRASVPATVRVFFHKFPEDGRGTEKDTPQTGNWEMSPAHSENVATGVAGAETGSVVAVWDDLPAIVSDSGTIVNTAALTARAEEVAENFVNRLVISESPGRLHYSGCITEVLPGSEVSHIVWRDYGDGRHSAAGGLITEIHREPLEKRCAGLTACNENLQSPDLGRHSHPIYPNHAQILQINHSGVTAGRVVEANADGLHPSLVKRWVGGTMSDLEDCYVLFVDGYDDDEGDVLAVQGEYCIGRLVGWHLSDDETWPVYLVEPAERTFIGKADSTLTAGSSAGTFSVYHSTTLTDSTFNRTAKAVGEDVTSGKWAAITRVAGVWIATQLECD